MHGFDVVVDQQCQSLSQTMIDFSHLMEDLQQFFVGWAAGGQGVANGDHALAMASQCCHPLIDISNMPP